MLSINIILFISSVTTANGQRCVNPESNLGKFIYDIKRTGKTRKGAERAYVSTRLGCLARTAASLGQ